MSASADSSNSIVLCSSDGKEFTVNREIIKQLSGFVDGALLGVDDVAGEMTQIAVPLVDAANLARIVAFATHYANEKMRDFAKVRSARVFLFHHTFTSLSLLQPLANPDLAHLVQPFYSEFITELNGTQLFDLTLAAQFMDIRPLFDLCCARIASFIRGQTPEMIRKELEIPEEFTAEEEAAVKAENAWVEEN